MKIRINKNRWGKGVKLIQEVRVRKER